MGTRAAAFTAKIKTLQDAQLRLMQSPSQGGGGGGGASSGGNPPNGIELANTLKWFSTTLLNVFKVRLLLPPPALKPDQRAAHWRF